MPNANVTEMIFTVWDTTSGFGSAEARARFSELLASSSTDFSDIDKAQLTTQLARTLGFTQFEEAHKALDEAQAVFRAEQAKNADSTASAPSMLSLIALKMRIELERGRVYNSAGMPEHAEPHFRAACEAASDATASDEHKDPSVADALDIIDFLKVDALHMLAIVATSNALRTSYAKEGIAIARRADRARGRTHTWLGPLLNNLGWETLEAGDAKNAITILQEAADVRREELNSLEGGQSDVEGEKRQRKAFTAWKIAVWSIGHAQVQAGRKEDAYVTLTGLLEQNADGPSIREDLAHLCLWKSGRSEKSEYEQMAVEHAKRALELGVDGMKAQNLQELISKHSESDPTH